MKQSILQNEPALLKLIAEGDEFAFRKIFNHYKDKLFNYTYRITDNEGLAEEIVMDAFLKIWCNREDLIYINRFDAYLYTIIRNRAFSAIKRRAQETLIITRHSNISSEYQECTEETVVYNEYQYILKRAINKLPPQQKLVYSMSREEGLKYEEIADQLNLSKNTVKAHLKKALNTLRLVVSNLLVLFFVASLFRN